MSANRLHRQGIEFARRGFASLIVMRRGYGTSGGGFAESSGPCGNRDYLRAARQSASDLRAAASAAIRREGPCRLCRLSGIRTAQGFCAVAAGSVGLPFRIAHRRRGAGQGARGLQQPCTGLHGLHHRRCAGESGCGALNAHRSVPWSRPGCLRTHGIVMRNCRSRWLQRACSRPPARGASRSHPHGQSNADPLSAR